MRKLSILAGVLSVALAAVGFTSILPVPARAADGMQGMDMSAKAEAQRPRCENCGMFTDVSSTRVTAQVAVDGKTGDHLFVCPGCLREKLEGWGGKAELKGFKVLDYTTFKTNHEKMIDGMDAYYLFGTKELPGSMDEPYVAAFATKEAAAKAQPKLGGDVVHGWDALRAKLEAAEQKDSNG
jgi:hypothetical protein